MPEALQMLIQVESALQAESWFSRRSWKGYFGKFHGKWHDQDRRINAYKTVELDDRTAHDLVIRATDVGVCSNRLIPAVLREWREPRHEEFEERSVWSRFNSFTEALKDGTLADLPKKTEALHGLLDVHVELH